MTLVPGSLSFTDPVVESVCCRLIRRSFWKWTMSRAMEELRGYFAVHSQGLGHATRAVALGRGLLDRRGDWYLRFLAGSPALDLVAANGFDALTRPPAPDLGAAEWALCPRG